VTWKLGLIDELLRFISGGNIAGLPPLVVMTIPLILGLVVGFFVKKFLKIALIAGLIIAAVTYLGFFSLSLDSLRNIIAQYGPMSVHYIVLLLGILPLSVGLIIGLTIGFLFG
jgi:uncharacterized membrane protein (Fun14 family)